MLVEPVVADLGLKSGDGVLAFVNGMGGSPLIELYVAYHSVSRILQGKGVELTELWDAPVHTAALRWGV